MVSVSWPAAHLTYVSTQESHRNSSAFMFSTYVRLNQLLKDRKCSKPLCLSRKVPACCEPPASVLMLQEQHSQPRALKGMGCLNPPKTPVLHLVQASRLCLPDSPRQCIKLLWGTSHPAPLQPERGTRRHESHNSPLSVHPSAPGSDWYQP